MSADTPHEIVIVRRAHGDHDDGHHGGVWKIAFADFMTAMMCFFLVMWLINASNEETKAAVASYFNPVKLTDRTASRKSLEEIGQGPEQGMDAQEPQPKGGESEAGPSSYEGTVESSEIKKEADEQLFADPYAVLAEIASDTGIRQNISEQGDGGAQLAGPATGASGGEAYRDPFAPDFWSQQVALPNDAEASAEPQRTAHTGDGGDLDAKGEVEAKRDAASVSAEFEATMKALEKPEAEQHPVKAPDEGAPSPEAKEAADQIRRELAEALLPGDKMKDGISVVATDKGVQVSVTDQLQFGMFEIGSAVPRRELVLAMDKVGHAIAKQKGTVTISGHTDARPYRGEAYDNWRLSTARAHSAQYMLVRGGLDEGRIKEVAGFADRKPKDSSDPLAAVNRRIEILLEIGG
ncbi:MotB family protein [Pseudaminobacter sp. 19-2017]|uniref:MotB family protein n=1 Tax=Pseudaminobacter soli (ex Zhang et al. 2022) TaxID=2831468 RepID=A0A942DZ88_9HYPH|nr:MotB family protein [Pseudaminobacter soli]MBS3650341.1 MotB family protein [Pseudaminobacter soli]